MANLSYGSKGSEVKKLQEELNKQGYKLDVDGIYGNKTQAAVRDYQKKSGLAVDGIAGSATMGSFNKVAQSQATPRAPTPTTRPLYSQSDELKTATGAVNQWESNKPKEYASQYQSQIDALLDSVLSGKKFDYNINEDELYRQYKDKYTQLGQKAMQDTVGQAAALTGGYGSSYGVTAGSQAYQSYLEKLNDITPQLQQAAYERFVREQQLERDNLGLLQGLDDKDYGKYRDAISDYYTEGNYLLNKRSNMSDEEWRAYLQNVSGFESDRGYAFDQDKFAYQKEQDKLAQSNWEKQFNLAQQAKSSSGGSGGGGSTTKAASKYSDSELKAMANAGNIKGVIAALEEDYPSTEALFNKITSYGIPADEVRAELESYFGGPTPTTYNEFLSATGYAGILTASEFSKRDSAKNQYGSYSEYLKAMYDKYR